MKHLQNQGCLPPTAFSIRMPIPEIANLLLNFYVQQVNNRNREFIPDSFVTHQILQIAEILGTPSHRFAIILMGQYGNGKTTMLRAIRNLIHFLFDSCDPSIRHLEDFRPSIPIVAAKDMVKHIISEEHSYRLEDMVMIDDWGSEPTEILHYGMIYTPIVDLIEARYARMQYTILSTNLKVEDIRPKYKHRCADRLNEMAHVVHFSGESYRNI